jgi:hypothetical protein
MLFSPLALTMKRRSVEASKRIRPSRKPKPAENVNSSNYPFYAGVCAVWALIFAMDYNLEYRLEYLWPVWLFWRSCQDSFRYQGMVFMMLFVGLVLVSDTVCFVLLPSSWLLFAASNYVWVQLLWQSGWFYLCRHRVL